MRFREFIKQPKKIFVEIPESLLLNEATLAKVGRYTARRDPPHFQGDEYHAHADVPDGYEVAWGKSGVRRHPKKFPANVPADAKAAVASVLGVSVDLLETFTIFDESIQKEVFLIEVREL